MRQRSRSSFLATLATLPWPVGLFLGIACFAAVRWLAPWIVPRLENPLLRPILEGLVDGPLQVFAWILLVAFWGAAGVSFVNRRKRRTLLATQADLDSIRALDWRRFEMLVGEAFRQQGYRVEEAGLGGPDGGVDLVLRREGKTTLVQCKHWRKRQIPVATVREMYGLMPHHHADAVKIVCSGDFSLDALRFAKDKPIELIGGQALAALIARTQGAAAPVAGDQPGMVPEATRTAHPACGACGAQLIERTNRTTGVVFLGCSRYPACRFTANLR